MFKLGGIGLDYIYLLGIFLMVLLLYEGVTTAFSYAPKKIKHITIGTLILVLFRYISLFILFINKKPLYLYLLKPIIFLEIVYLPIIGFITIYMLYRNEKIKLNYFYSIVLIFSLFYMFVTLKSPVNTMLSDIYGYVIILREDYGLYLILEVVNTIYLILAMKALGYKYSNKLGLALMILSASLTVLTILISLLGVNLFGVKILGEILWILTLVYSLRQFKKKSIILSK